MSATGEKPEGSDATPGATRSSTEAERAGARELTDEIRSHLRSYQFHRERVADLIEQARDEEVHNYLGYVSWTAYVEAEFSDCVPGLSRNERRELVERLSELGMSTRAIAPVVGATHTTVVRDLAGGTNVPPEEDRSPAAEDAGVGRESTVTGRNGKSYPQSGDRSRSPDSGAVNGRDPADVADAAPQDAITGRDGKTYLRKTRAPGARRSIVDKFTEVAKEHRRIAGQYKKLSENPKFSQFGAGIAGRHYKHLLRNLLLEVELLRSFPTPDKYEAAELRDSLLPILEALLPEGASISIEFPAREEDTK